MIEFPNVANFVARAARDSGFEREKFIDSKLPEDFNKIVVFLFFGDLRSLSVLSMLLFKPFRENILNDKYVIVCSYPGMGGLFPGADEFWSVSDGLAISDLMNNAYGFKNNDKKAEVLAINLRRHFYAVLTCDDLLPFYNNGLTSVYFDRFKKVERYFPAVPPWRGGEYGMALSKRGNLGIFIYPNVRGKCWDRNKEVDLELPKDFWIKLVERMVSSNYFPLIYQNQASYDISPYFGEKCFYCSDRSFISVLSAMRSTSCVLDVFSGISRLSISARCPFLALDERQRYIKSKELEVNDLCIAGMYPYRYIMSFPTIIGSGNYAELINQVMNVAADFVPKLAKLDLPPLSESCEEVSYDVVRQYKKKKLGINFLKVERLVIK